MTPEAHPRALVVDHAVAHAAGLAGQPGTHATAAPSRRARRIDAEGVIEVLEAAGAGALVLARPPWSDSSTAPLPAVAIVLGFQVLWLPAGLGAAAWAAALIASWARTTPADDLLRRAQVAVGLAGLPPSRLPMREWGPDAVAVPAMGPDALARWCDCAWCGCDWCAQGGMEGAPCPACGQREPS